MKHNTRRIMRRHGLICALLMLTATGTHAEPKPDGSTIDVKDGPPGKGSGSGGAPAAANLEEGPPGKGSGNDGSSGTAKTVFSNQVAYFKSFADELNKACTERLPNALQSRIDEKIAELEARSAKLGTLRQFRTKKTLSENDKAAMGQHERELEPYTDITQEMRAIDAQREKLREFRLLAQDGIRGSINALEREIKKGICAQFCSGNGTPEHVVDVCQFRNQSLAAAAIIADPGSVTALARYVKDRIDASRSLRELREASGLTQEDIFTFAGNASQLMDLSGQHGAVGVLTTESVRIVDRALAGLARVIADRAKREALIWFLGRLHRNVCGESGSESPAIRELRDHWLPSLCSLASQRQNFTQYGGGAALLGALQGAIKTDVHRWPGVAAGLGMAALFWQDTGTGTDLSLLGCSDTSGVGARCNAARMLRTATTRFVNDLLAGMNTLVALHEYSTAINGLNLHNHEFHSTKVQVAACMASIPLEIQTYHEAVSEQNMERVAAMEALLLGALARAPACFSIVGKGWEVDKCQAFGAPRGECNSNNQTENQKSQVGLDSGRIERLTTILRWAKHVHDPAHAALTRLDTLNETRKRYENALKALQENSNGNNNSASVLPELKASLDIAGVKDARTVAEAMRALESYTQNAARTLQQSEQVKLLKESVALAHAAIDLGIALTEAGQSITEVDLYPGLCNMRDCSKNPPWLSKGHDALIALSERLETVEVALVEDWGQAVPRIIAMVRTDITRACSKDDKCPRLADSLSRYAGVFTALATSSDPEQVAQALDAAAMPVGGWQRKVTSGATLISIAAFPGIGTAGELRWGQYGVHYERGGDWHLAAPTLVMPLGIDFVWPWCDTQVKVFASVLDPAAYLQYDAGESGRLPGAQIITALAPGLAIRWTPWDAPFSINFFGMYRPNLRSWESSVSGPAADAFQFGASLAVDVTLFELYSSDPEIKD